VPESNSHQTLVYTSNKQTNKQTNALSVSGSRNCLTSNQSDGRVLADFTYGQIRYKKWLVEIRRTLLHCVDRRTLGREYRCCVLAISQLAELCFSVDYTCFSSFTTTTTTAADQSSSACNRALTVCHLLRLITARRETNGTGPRRNKMFISRPLKISSQISIQWRQRGAARRRAN